MSRAFYEENVIALTLTLTPSSKISHNAGYIALLYKKSNSGRKFLLNEFPEEKKIAALIKQQRIGCKLQTTHSVNNELMGKYLQ